MSGMERMRGPFQGLHREGLSRQIAGDFDFLVPRSMSAQENTSTSSGSANCEGGMCLNSGAWTLEASHLSNLALLNNFRYMFTCQATTPSTKPETLSHKLDYWSTLALLVVFLIRRLVREWLSSWMSTEKRSTSQEMVGCPAQVQSRDPKPEIRKGL